VPWGKRTSLIRLVEAGRIDLKPLFTHRFVLNQIGTAYDLFASRRDGVLKVAVAV
jgi:threonine dehydrogenase-like Zn-dependent dehydrogenase